MSTDLNKSDHKLPEPGKVYAIPADTHADLDLQDDKEQIFYSRRQQQSQFAYYRARR